MPQHADLEQNTSDLDAFVHVHAMLASVVEHHEVELTPDHLPGL